MTKPQAVGLIFDELARAERKFPAGFHSGHEGFAVIREEVDELWESVKRDDTLNASREAVQVASMALRYLVMLGDYESLVAYTGGLEKASM